MNNLIFGNSKILKVYSAAVAALLFTGVVCGFPAAAENGEIQKSRLESYKALFEELKDIKPWQAKR